VRHLTDRATGASYPAVTERVIRELRVPLPSLAEQRRIAALLDKADAIRRKGGRAPSVLDNLLRASYVHLVGEMHPAYAHWTECRIEDLADPRDGAMRTGPFGSALRHSEFSERGDVAVLGIDNAVSNRFRPGAPRFLSRERFENGLTRYAVNAYDVLITIMGTTGRSAVVPQGIGLAISTKHLATITVDRNRVAPEFLSHAIHCDPGVLRQIGAANRGAIMTGLNLRAIRRLKLRLPPIAAQERFAAVVARIRQIQAKCEQADNLSSTLVESLADASFRTSG
jgi:type I restriction enzyme S subunit